MFTARRAVPALPSPRRRHQLPAAPAQHRACPPRCPSRPCMPSAGAASTPPRWRLPRTHRPSRPEVTAPAVRSTHLRNNYTDGQQEARHAQHTRHTPATGLPAKTPGASGAARLPRGASAHHPGQASAAGPRRVPAASPHAGEATLGPAGRPAGLPRRPCPDGPGQVGDDAARADFRHAQDGSASVAWRPPCQRHSHRLTATPASRIAGTCFADAGATRSADAAHRPIQCHAPSPRNAGPAQVAHPKSVGGSRGTGEAACIDKQNRSLNACYIGTVAASQCRHPH